MSRLGDRLVIGWMIVWGTGWWSLGDLFGDLLRDILDVLSDDLLVISWVAVW